MNNNLVVSKYDYRKNFSESELDSMVEEIRAAIKEGNTILSEHVQSFEHHFGDYLGVDYVYGCNSGTDSLHLALRALDIKIGDEVVIPANTFYATAVAITLVGAKPVLCDVDEETFLMTTENISKVITPQTKAVIAVHLYGNACNVSAISMFCKAHGLYFVEDCAQAHGAKWNNSYVGSQSDVGCFSFHPSKNLPASGDAGASVTQNKSLALKLKKLRHLGQKEQNVHELIGLNSKLDSIQAIILNQCLLKLDEWNSKKRVIADKYKELLKNTPVKFQKVNTKAFCVYHLMQIKVDKSLRDKLLDFLKDSGIDVAIRYPTPIHLQESFRYLNQDIGKFPISEMLSESLLCLPIHAHLTDQDIVYVSHKIIDFFKKKV